jgi:hypothetical protein
MMDMRDVEPNFMESERPEQDGAGVVVVLAVVAMLWLIGLCLR